MTETTTKAAREAAATETLSLLLEAHDAMAESEGDTCARWQSVYTERLTAIVSRLAEREEALQAPGSTDATRKIVIAPGHSFKVSEKVYQSLGLEWDHFGYLTRATEYHDEHGHVDRSNPRLIAAIEKVGLLDAHPERCLPGSNTDPVLTIVEIPADVDWYIESDDDRGTEWVAERHRTWGKIE